MFQLWDPQHIQRSCPLLDQGSHRCSGRSPSTHSESSRQTGGNSVPQSEAPGRYGRSSTSQVAVADRGDTPITTGSLPNTTDPKQGDGATVDEETVQQMETLLASMRLKMEQSNLRKSRVGTVIAQSADAVGPILSVKITVEGCPVTAVVDTGAQSTIMSRETLHRVAQCRREAGHGELELIQPSAKLYGRSGADSSELRITAETPMEIVLDNRHVIVPVFIQPGSDIPCLLGMNVLPHLGVKILRAHGEALLSPTTVEDAVKEGSLPSAEGHSGSDNRDATEENDNRDATEENDNSDAMEENDKSGATGTREGKVCIIRSTYFPPGKGRVLEVELQCSAGMENPLLFEPYDSVKLNGLQSPESVLMQHQEGKIRISLENNSAISTRLEQGQCVGTVTPVQILSVEEIQRDTPVEPDSANTPTPTLRSPSIQFRSSSSEPTETNKRLEKLFNVLSLENDSITGQQLRKLKKVIELNADVFALDNSEVGHTDLVKHRVDTGDIPPIKKPVRRVPFMFHDKIAEMVEEMESLGVIRPSSNAWSSPVVLVPKKDNTYRFCVDYRRLNLVTKKDVYPLPRIDDILDTLAGAKYFTTLDLASGYWQIALDPETASKSAFITHQGLHEFVRMPFGMCNAPATFQRLMEVVLGGLLWKNCFVYIDDVLVCSRTFEEHLTHLQQVLSRLREAGLRLKAKECLFLRQEVTYLGHLVTPYGVTPDPAKTSKIQDYPRPVDVTQVRQFLGLASYYRRFVSGFAKTASPLHALLKKNAQFNWMTDCEDAFIGLKEALVHTPVLMYPQFNGQHPFILETDASTQGLEAVLAQQQEDQQVHPVAFASRSLSPAEQRYSITELETLGLVWAVKLFRPYILGHRCIVFTDHAACTSLLTAKNPSSKQVRWALSIQEFDLDIRHRSGKSNRVADALSRNPIAISQVLTFQSAADHGDDSTHTPVGVVSMTAALDMTPTSDVVQPPPANSVPNSDIGQLQRQDSHLLPWFNYIENDKLPTEETLVRRLVMEQDWFEIVDGVLYTHNPAKSEQLRLVVPQCLQLNLLKEYHDGRFAGHFAERKLYATISRQYWWKGMRAYVCRFCRSCLVCASRKGTGRKTRPPLKSIPVGGPFEMIGVDVLQLPLSHLGNEYAVVFQDYLTKWPEVFAVADQKAQTIAHLLVEQIIARHGVPQRLLSD